MLAGNELVSEPVYLPRTEEATGSSPLTSLVSV